jgi:hypothetical protein
MFRNTDSHSEGHGSILGLDACVTIEILSSLPRSPPPHANYVMCLKRIHKCLLQQPLTVPIILQLTATLHDVNEGL